MRRGRLTSLLILWALLVPVGEARAQAEVGRARRLLEEGDSFMRLGSYFQASERYSAAVLATPSDGRKKLAFGHALFALGHYAYASFNFRRGLRYLGYPDGYALDLTAVFPGRPAVARALGDLQKYLGYYPGDYHALTVLAYVSFFSGDQASARGACTKLLKENRRDPFASYLLRRIEQPGSAVVARREPQPQPRPAAKPPAPALAGLDADLPEGLRAEVAPPLLHEDPTPALARP